MIQPVAILSCRSQRPQAGVSDRASRPSAHGSLALVGSSSMRMGARRRKARARAIRAIYFTHEVNRHT
jgi:hypothetical protein